MRLGLLAATVFAVLAPAAVTAAEPETTPVELRSDILVSGLPLAESDKPVYGLRLTAQVDKKGEGSGTLELDLNAPAYDEFGFQTAGGNLPPMMLECTLKFVKKKKLQLPAEARIAAPLVNVDWVLFEIQGSKITSRLSLATEEKVWSWARLLVHDKDGKVRNAIGVRTPPPPQPCHPGCFPAGTPIHAPCGVKAVESLRAGDVVTTVGPDGTPGQGKVASVFVTKNRLIEVRTDEGTLTTTETQPLALSGGGLRAAGELKAGDRIHSWDGRERRVVTVRSVVATDREAQVFNVKNRDKAQRLNDAWGVGAVQARYHHLGNWYDTLVRFPAALFDPHGYVYFNSEAEYRNAPMWIRKRIGVRKPGISGMPGYVRMTETLEPDEHDLTVNKANQQRPTQNAVIQDIRAIEKTSIEATTKEALIQARLGQGKFRDQVLERWQNRCSMTGSKVLEVIRASHIKPWRESTDTERLDPFNGLPLVASLDALFDVGLFSFKADGSLIVSPELSAAERRILGLNRKVVLTGLAEKTLDYLKHHRRHKFRQ
jgi:hypothetical protein